MRPLTKDVFKIGMAGGLVITIGMMTSRAIEVTPMNFELSLGALLTTQIDAVAWVIGFAMHLLISGFIALGYMALFQRVGRSGALVGAEVGLVHWGISGIMMAFVPRLFSLMPGIMEPPGIFGSNFGPANVIFNILVHLGYGVVVGVGCARLLAQAKPAQPLKPVETPEAMPRRAA
jgi:hypothetical protein